MLDGYRVVEIRNGEPCSLFHGTGGSRTIPVGVAVFADKKMVKNGSGGTEYMSGWHVFPILDDALYFYDRVLRNHTNRAVIRVYVTELDKKAHSRGNIWLADIMIIPDDWADNILHQLDN